MSEIVYDGKLTQLELSSDLGLNFSSANPRLKHTGSGTFSISSTVGKLSLYSGSSATDSFKIDSDGGIDIDADALISIETSDTINGIKMAVTNGVPLTMGTGSDTITMGNDDTESTINGNVTITGNLTVTGDTVSHEVLTVRTEDPIIKLAHNVTGTPTTDIGFVGERGDSDNIGFLWDESADEFITVYISDDAQLDLVSSVQHINFSNYAPLHTAGQTIDGNITLYTGNSISINHTSDADNEDLTISQLGAFNSSLILISAGTGADAIKLDADVGGMQFVAGVNNAITIESDGTVGINTTNPDNTFDLDVNGTANSHGVYQNDSLLVPPGCIMPYAVASAPGGWLICNGSAVSRTTYSALFSVIGITYGTGNGSTTFNLPNLSGKMIVGLDAGDADFNNIGETGGSKTRTLSTNELPAHTHSGTTNTDGAHTHTITDPGHSHTVNRTLQTTGADTSAAQDNTGGEPDVTTTVTTTSSTSTTGISINSGGSHTHSFTTGSTGSGNSFSLMNPYMALNYIIKV